MMSPGSTASVGSDSQHLKAETHSSPYTHNWPVSQGWDHTSQAQDMATKQTNL